MQWRGTGAGTSRRGRAGCLVGEAWRAGRCSAGDRTLRAVVGAGRVAAVDAADRWQPRGGRRFESVRGLFFISCSAPRPEPLCEGVEFAPGLERALLGPASLRVLDPLLAGLTSSMPQT